MRVLQIYGDAHFNKMRLTVNDTATTTNLNCHVVLQQEKWHKLNELSRYFNHHQQHITLTLQMRVNLIKPVQLN